MIEDITLPQLIFLFTLPIMVMLIVVSLMKRSIPKWFDIYGYVAVSLFTGIIVFSNCSFKPFSKHDCYCEGYKDASGSYPNDDKHIKRKSNEMLLDIKVNTKGNPKAK